MNVVLIVFPQTRIDPTMNFRVAIREVESACAVVILPSSGSSLCGNAPLQPTQIAVTGLRRNEGHKSIPLRRPTQGVALLPAPMFSMAVGKREVGAVLVPRVREYEPLPASGLKDTKPAARAGLGMDIAENKRATGWRLID